MNYNGRELSVVVIYPPVAEAIAKYRNDRGLEPVAAEELKYGMDEVMTLVNTLGAKLLSGARANIHGMIEILDEGVDILWILTHGTEEGWFLADGIVTASETTSLVRSSGTFLTVLNTCSSYEVANAVAEELGTALICTIAEVPDRQAFITGVLFARHLASGADYITAYERAKPGQSHPYVLIPARREMTQNDRERGRYAPGGQQPDAATFQRFFQSVEELERIVNGSPRLGLPPLRELTNKLQKELAEVKYSIEQVQATLAQIKATQQERNRLVLGMTIVIIALLISVGVLVMRGG
jgi:hypothetical protein